MLFQTNKPVLSTLIFFFFLCTHGYGQETAGDLRIENSAKIDQLITLKKEHNKNSNVLKGYKIQLFYGNEKEAYEIKDEFEALFQEISTKIIFSSPEWKVQAGNYKSRLQADRSLVEIKKEYPSAIIFATEIEDEN